MFPGVLEYWNGFSWIPVRAGGGGGESPFVLRGFVEGGPAVDGLVQTSRGPEALLCNLPAGGTVSLGDHRLSDVAWPEADQDAINVETIWALLNDDI